MSSVSNIVTNAIALTVAVVYYVWLLPQEIAIYRGRSKKITPGISPVAFILLRYAGLLALITSLLFAIIKTEHCRVLITANQVGVILVIACSGLLFLLPAIHKWEGNQVISATLGILYMAMLVCSCVTAAQFQTVPSNDGPETCKLHPLSSLSALGYGASLLFGLAVLVCLLAKQPTQSSRRSDYLITACVGIATIADLAWLVIHALGNQTEGAKLSIAPFGTAIMVLTGAQVALSAHKREPILPIISRPLNTLTVLQVGRPNPGPNIFVSPPTPSGKKFTLDIPAGGNRPDTPFSSYDYESDAEENMETMKSSKAAYITREVVITVE